MQYFDEYIRDICYLEIEHTGDHILGVEKVEWDGFCILKNNKISILVRILSIIWYFIFYSLFLTPIQISF
jgi:hypothetical protein